jgi:hypothetical protein
MRSRSNSPAVAFLLVLVALLAAAAAVESAPLNPRLHPRLRAHQQLNKPASRKLRAAAGDEGDLLHVDPWVDPDDRLGAAPRVVHGRALRAEPAVPKPSAAAASAAASADAAAKPAATDKAAAAAKPAAPAKLNPETIGAALGALADAPANAPPDEAKLATFGIKRIESPEAELQDLLIGPDSGYDPMSFPWAEFGPANVSINIAFHRVLDVDLYSGGLAGGLHGDAWAH